jgi:hypothetical protein
VFLDPLSVKRAMIRIISTIIQISACPATRAKSELCEEG